MDIFLLSMQVFFIVASVALVVLTVYMILEYRDRHTTNNYDELYELDYIDRMIDELYELEHRIFKLTKFMESDDYNLLDDINKKLLRLQYGSMTEYKNTLEKRIGLAELK